MTALRRLIRNRPHLLGWIVALVLAVRLLMPAGFMPGSVDGLPAIVACPGSATAHHGAGHDAPAPDSPCDFAALGAPLIDAVDAVLLAVALAFVMLRAVRPVSVPRRVAVRWRPPLRAPPVTPFD